jgi:hypothetical protein
MKKGKLLIVCLIGILLAGGLFLVGCEEKCGNPGNCNNTSGLGCAAFSCSSGCASMVNWNSSTTYECDC